MKKQGPVILVVDNEPEILHALQRSLLARGYAVLTAMNGADALHLIEHQKPDLLLLDLVMPGMSGLEVCRQARSMSSLPILILSIRDTEHEKIEALDQGADDYIAKPFSINEVLARIRASLRRVGRMQQEGEPPFHAGPLAVDFVLRQVTLNGEPLSLTPTEYELLRIFIRYRGKLLTRSMLFQHLWGNQDQSRVHSLHVYVAKLRQKIEPVPEQPRFIFTVPGIGYRFQEEVLESGPEPNGDGDAHVLRS